MLRIVYSPRYNIGFFGFERLHPFDSRKYGRAWRSIRRAIGWRRLRALSARPRRAVTSRELFAVHAADYLGRLHGPAYVARALEVPLVARLPYWLINWCVLRPMRWATMGTVVAARAAVEHGLAVNLGGGFHHAKRNGGEGFCIYADIALAVHTLRAEQRLPDDARVAYVDLDAHQGNGVCHVFRDDRRVFIFDMYNPAIYPAYDRAARERIDCDVPVGQSWGDADYLAALRSRLPGFLDSIGRGGPVGLAIYNAGTDIFRGDPLGQMNVSAAGVLERDLFVVQELRSRGIPTVLLTSGGYTRESYQLIARSVVELVERYAG